MSLQIIKKLLAVFLLIFITACSSYEPPAPTSSGNPSTDTAALDTAAPPDVNGIKPEDDKKNKRYGILGYSYFKSIRQNETRNINAYVSIINSVSKVIDTLKEINNEITPERANDTASIYTKNIILYKYLRITLIDPDSDFTIRAIHENDRQEIDSLAGNSWVWAITPRTDKEQSRLLLKVIAEKPDKNKEVFEVRNIPITVNVDKNIFREIYLWLYHNPEKTLVLLLIPFVGFFWRNLISLFKKRK